MSILNFKVKWMMDGLSVLIVNVLNIWELKVNWMKYLLYEFLEIICRKIKEMEIKIFGKCIDCF